MKKSKIENNEPPKTCRKCGRALLVDGKQKICEHCRDNKIANIKKVGAGIVGVATAVGGIAVAVVKGALKR